MRISRRYKPHLLCSSTFPHLSRPWLSVEEKRLYATDGHAIASFPAKVDADETSRVVGKRPVNAGPFPRPSAIATALPDIQPGDPGTVTVAFDVRLLNRVVEAIGVIADGDDRQVIEMTFLAPPSADHGVETQLVIRPVVGLGEKPNDAVAAMMPCRTGAK